MYIGVDNSQNLVDRLKRERDRFVAFAFASADILMELDKEGNIRYIDGATMKLLSKNPEELQGKNFFDVINQDDRDLAEYFLGKESQARVDNLNIRLKTKTGTCFPFIMSGYRISELQGHFYLTLSTFRSDLNLSDIARRDLDTGLLRKAEFSLAINKQLIMSRFSEKTPLMTMIRVEGLNKIEATQDDLKMIMRDIGDVARGHSINRDSAGLININTIGLVHEDNIKSPEIIAAVKKLLARTSPFAKSIEFKTVSIKLVADTEISEEDSAQAIVYTIDKFADGGMADFNLNSLSESYEEMVSSTIERIAEFRQTVDDELFDLAFQPIVEVNTGRVSHFEVLTRLRSAAKFSNPFQFIEFGENVGMISDFDFKMVCRSLDLLKKMKSEGVKPILAVNLSGFSLSSKLFLDKLFMLLTKNREYCQQFIFEITESARVTNIKSTNEYFRKLRKLGVRCSIDDFGTGEATFEYLHNLHVDIIKIDGSYVSEEAMNSPHGRHLLKAIGNLCADMEVEVIGEKVEDARGAAMLKECGIQYAQGYYYAKPDVSTDILSTTEIIKETAKIAKMDDYRD